MGKVWQIYKTDWKNILSVSIVALMIGALALLPSAYAWFNIKSMWNPYENTSGIQVAVASEDEGAIINGKKMNVGKDTVKNLKKNHQLGWVFVSRSEAVHGVEHGDYYAYLIIPKDFSKKLASILEKTPQKPEIFFGVNEKINAVAPKITSSGATSVTTQISESFVKTVSDAIFSGFFKAGVELEKNLPSILSAEKQILELEMALPKIEEMGKKAIELESKLSDIHAKGQQVIELEKRIPELDKAGDSILKVESKLPLVKDAGEKVVALQGKISDIQQTASVLGDIVTVLSDVEAKIKQAIDNAGIASQADTSGDLAQLIQLYNQLKSIHGVILDSRANLQQKVDKVVGDINTAADFMKNEWPTVEQKIHRAADFVRNDLPEVKNNIHQAANLVRTKLPEVEHVIHKAADLARNDLPGFEEKVRTAANQIRRFEGSVNINDLIQFLKHDPHKESSFLAKPVLIKTKRLFPIPNYGSAMTPFYTMLALWVGATLLAASVSVNVANKENQYRDYHLYFGRLLTFQTIGVCQAAIVSLGDLFLLHTYVVDKLWFVLLCIFISMVFMTIVYTLCSVFGNVGKGISIIFLVLQISSSGATFPVSLTPSFFQKLNPFMPFTYAVSMLRETVGGMVNEVVVKDVLALIVFVGISFLLAFVLKRPLSKWIHRTAERARSTKLIP